MKKAIIYTSVITTLALYSSGCSMFCRFPSIEDILPKNPDSNKISMEISGLDNILLYRNMENIAPIHYKLRDYQKPTQ